VKQGKKYLYLLLLLPVLFLAGITVENPCLKNFSQSWLSEEPNNPYDLNADGIVNFLDYILLPKTDLSIITVTENNVVNLYLDGVYYDTYRVDEPVYIFHSKYQTVEIKITPNTEPNSTFKTFVELNVGESL
jgi:hypothetical protein